MPLSKIQLEQTDFEGLSGTLVSDEELLDASGFLQIQIPDVLNDLDDIILTSPVNGEVLQFNGTNWENAPPSGFTGSGITEEEATDIALDIASSGVTAQVRILPPLGHYHNSSELIINDLFPAVEFPNGDDKFISWNVLAPLLLDENANIVTRVSPSGMHVLFFWSTIVADSGTVKWRAEVTPHAAGDNLDSVIQTDIDILTPDQVYAVKDINLGIISASGLDFDKAIQLRLRRIGSEDSVIQTVYTFNVGISYF